MSPIQCNMSRKKYEDDDGRRIVDMSGIEMPNDPLLGGSFQRKQKKGPKEDDPDTLRPHARSTNRRRGV